MGSPNPSSAESSSWLIRSVTKDEVEDSNAEEIVTFNNKNKTKNKKNHPEGEKQAGRQKTGTQSNMTHITLNTLKTMDQHRTADTRRLYRETNEDNEGDTAGATETMIK